MRPPASPLGIVAAAAIASSARRGAVVDAFRFVHRPRPSHRTFSPPSTSSSALLAKKKKSSGGGGKGFGPPKKKKKYSLQDKSYGTPPPSSSDGGGAEASRALEQTPEEREASMQEFFAAHGDWTPLFSYLMDDGLESDDPLATPFLSDVAAPDEPFGISTLECKHPWRLLPPKPESESALAVVAKFLDEWQQSLLDIPLDSIVTGDNDRHFLEEGRRTIAVTRFHVLEGSDVDDDAGDDGGTGDDWEAELFQTCWSEVAHLSSRGEPATGSLVLLPEGSGDLESARSFVEQKLLRPIEWLGRGNDWEIVAMERGTVGVRLLYRLGEIPDLKDRDSDGDEGVSM